MTSNSQDVMKNCDDSGEVSFNSLNTLELHGNLYKEKNGYKSNIPRLILVSSKDDDGCNTIFDALENVPIDYEQIALLRNNYNYNIPGHIFRSYTILDANVQKTTISLARDCKFYSGTTRPVWFLYSGLGSQWAGAGKDLMQIPIFASAIHKCHKVLEPEGIDIINIITSPDKSILDNNLNAMLCVNAIQIGLTDVLKAIGIVPDYLIGISVGELGCAYADGCLTAEETILLSYRRGEVCIKTEFIFGLVAAVGVGYKDLQSILPPEVDIGCHNSLNSCTIMGPYEVMQKFLTKMSDEGVFFKEVHCSNIPFHTRYFAKTGPRLYAAMERSIKEPKLRSDKWISTSVLQHEWDQRHSKYASPEYFTNNLLNPVYFEESAGLIPEQAIIIELAPHGLMQAIMKRSHDKCLNVPLNIRNCPHSVTFFLEAIGQLYQAGLNPHLDVLYPKVECPVSTTSVPWF